MLKKVRVEYLNKSAAHCTEIIEVLKNELKAEDDLLVQEIVKDLIADWEKARDGYIELLEL